MTINHIDQLAEWWENAEEGVVQPGDTVIGLTDADNDAYEVFVAQSGESEEYDFYRILSRAPKPKPAWHDAVAVIAHTARFSERRPFALTHTEDVLDPYNTEWITRDDLLDPAPLIEAKVTDEMVKRGAQASTPAGVRYLRPYEVREVLTAALGLEAE